jgi:putative transposase
MKSAMRRMEITRWAMKILQRKSWRLWGGVASRKIGGPHAGQASQSRGNCSMGNGNRGRPPLYTSLKWAESRGIRIEHIQLGKPQQNAYVERYNRTVRYDWLAQYLFDIIDEVQESGTRWLGTYNHERPNMALGGINTYTEIDARRLLHF